MQKIETIKHATSRRTDPKTFSACKRGRILPWSLLPFFLLCLNPAKGQDASNPAPDTEGYEIRVKMRNYPDSLNHLLLLGRYNWSAQYITDTARYDAGSGTYLFQGSQPKEGGMYLIITADKQYVDFIFDQDQHIGIELEYPNLFSSIKFENSPENDAYQAFAEKGKDDFETMNRLQQEYKQASAEKDTSAEKRLRGEINALYEKMAEDRQAFSDQNPGNLMSAIFNAQKEVDVPPAPDRLPEEEKRMWQYEYYKNHYFDNFDLCDDRLLRTPLFYQRVKSFHDKVLYMQSPDSIKYAWERLIEKAKCNKEMFKMLVWYPVDEYQRSEIIGQDAVWVYLAKKYYLGGQAYWASPSIVENFRKRINRVEPLLIGNKPKEFYCPDSTIGQPGQNWVSVFSSPKRYTVIIFWSLSCGHCKTAMPQWHKLYMEKGREWDFEVIAICKDFDIPAWKKYIQDHDLGGWINLNGKESNLDYNDAWDITTTPTVYVLDREKRIVTKKIDAEYLEDFLMNWQRLHYPGEKFPF